MWERAGVRATRENPRGAGRMGPRYVGGGADRVGAAGYWSVMPSASPDSARSSSGQTASERCENGGRHHKEREKRNRQDHGPTRKARPIGDPRPGCASFLHCIGAFL